MFSKSYVASSNARSLLSVPMKRINYIELLLFTLVKVLWGKPFNKANVFQIIDCIGDNMRSFHFAIIII